MSLHPVDYSGKPPCHIIIGGKSQCLVYNVKNMKRTETFAIDKKRELKLVKYLQSVHREVKKV